MPKWTNFSDKKPLVFTTVFVFILIPILVYTIYQTSKLNEDEELANSIYQKQMETVLFSLNHYADDRARQWVNTLADPGKPVTENASALVLGNEPIQLVAITSEYDSLGFNVFVNDYIDKSQIVNSELTGWFQQNDSTLARLSEYLAAGFQKINPVPSPNLTGLKPDQEAISVMFYDQDSTLYNALFILEPLYWVEQVLGQKIQEIAQDDFVIGVLKIQPTQPDSEIIIQVGSVDLQKEYVKSELWILPNLYITIQPAGESYSELLRERKKVNLSFLGIALLIFITGAFILYRNIQNTMKVAQLKSDFVSNVSHEIRTPLSLIKMYAETLQMGRVNSEEKRQQYYEVINQESARLSYLVNNILDFSRIEANRKKYDFRPINLNDIIQQIVDHYQYRFEQNKVTCRLNLSTSPLPISADREAVEEVVSNLIDNAIKYSTGNCSIEIVTKSENGHAICEVRDNGVGIAKDAIGKIFDKFYRVENALTQKTKGTGLGLSLVKHIMVAHNGSVSVASKPNAGSTFTLSFPLAETHV